MSQPFQPVNPKMQTTMSDRIRPLGTTAAVPSV
jgi:hypothetical protein